MIIGKSKNDLVVAQLINGAIIIGEKPVDGLIHNPISIQMVQDERGVGFKAGVVGEPILSRKVTTLAGVPEITNFILTPIPVSMCIVCNNLNDIGAGDIFVNLYNEVMTKIPEKDRLQKIVEAKETKEKEDKIIQFPSE